MDKQQMYNILDAIFKTLYNNMDKDGLHLEKQILEPNKFRLKPKEIENLWDILLATGLADSIIGFGKEGKIAITPAGIQMMTRYGSYKNFIASQQAVNRPQPQQLTIQLVSGDGDNHSEEHPAVEPARPEKPPVRKPVKKKTKPSK